VAFSWDGANRSNYDIYIKLVGPGEPVRLTKDSAHDERPAWSPDGRWIAFLRRTAWSGASLFLIPALGGGERKLADLSGPFAFSSPVSNLGWTPDSKWVAVGSQIGVGSRPGLWLVSVADSQPRRLTAADDASDHISPVFSPDGRSVAFVVAQTPSVGDIYILPLTPDLAAAGEPRRLTFENGPVHGLAWSPSGGALVFSTGGHLGSRVLKTITVEAAGTARNEPRLLAVGEQATSTSVSRGGRLVYARHVRDANLWKLPVAQEKQTSAGPQQLISSTYDEGTPDCSPDGRRIAFTSTRSGQEEIWIAEADGSNAVQLMPGYSAANPKWAPDGATILCKSRWAGTPDLYVVDVSSGSRRRLTSDSIHEVEPNWSRDGRWVYFSVRARKTDRLQIWKMPAPGGPARQITRHGGLNAQESPDGKWIYYAKEPVIPSAIWKAPAEGGEETQVVGDLSYSVNFAVGARGIYFVAKGEPRGAHTVAERRPSAAVSIDFFDFVTRKTTRLLRLEKTWWYGIALSRDERWLLYSVVDHAGSDLMLVENFGQLIGQSR